MKKIKKWFLRLILSLLLIGSALFLILHIVTYKPRPEANLAYESASSVKFDYTYFEPNMKPQKQSIVIYGGGLVDFKAYAYLAKGLADQGFKTYLLHSPFNLPILQQGQALKIIASEGLDEVYLVGHSLGGVVAAQDSKSGKKELAGLILLASYPADKRDLSSSDLEVLSITASQDQILNQDKYQAAKKRLPSSSHYLTIKGGNHSGFGLYGQQRGDGQSRLTATQQQDAVIEAITMFIEGN